MLECYIFVYRRKDAKTKEMYLKTYPKRRLRGRAIFSHLKDNLVSYGSFAKGNRNKYLDVNRKNLVTQSVVERSCTSIRQIDDT